MNQPTGKSVQMSASRRPSTQRCPRHPSGQLLPGPGRASRRPPRRPARHPVPRARRASRSAASQPDCRQPRPPRERQASRLPLFRPGPRPLPSVESPPCPRRPAAAPPALPQPQEHQRTQQGQPRHEHDAIMKETTRQPRPPPIHSSSLARPVSLMPQEEDLASCRSCHTLSGERRGTSRYSASQPTAPPSPTNSQSVSPSLQFDGINSAAVTSYS